ncbi:MULTISPECIES: DUF2290 domain-containing protein [unclassified Sphingobium]|uniref:DUF2290 domain-containing protein n=1 Tax=unclassified Sphingobium TaxID=2611147 RepID=UPI002225B08E|nr:MULTISPECIES: DUF2290 domain-containing protein [unclassified Sphingobium]MCW2411373.1 hypothetical protein [Sphingobium sp. B8D3D]MCW2416334.1 hypothetical protein [Sphingobium sp. B8D3A]
MTPSQICQQINEVIRVLVKEGLSDHQRFPAVRTAGSQVQITIPDAPNLSVSLKKKPYAEIYEELRRSESYHIRMLDGALIQFLFTFDQNVLSSHRLAFFPSPTLEMYETVPEHYDFDESFADIVGDFSIKFPIRFDYSSSDEKHVDVEHPKSHLTLGQYKGCRIPVNSPLTPFRFIRFTLRNFYNPAYFAVDFDDAARASGFPNVITQAEQGILFVTA